MGVAGQFIHVAGALKEIAEVHTGECGGQMAHNAGNAGSAADGFRHFKSAEPVGGAGETVQFAVLHGDGAAVLGEVKTGSRVSIHAVDHIVLRFLGSAGLGNVHDQGLFQIADCQCVHGACGVGIVQEVDLEITTALGVGQFIPIRTVDRHLDQLGTEGGTADAVDDGVFKFLAGAAGDGAAADTFHKFFHIREDLAAGVNAAVREMGHFPVFVRVLDLADLDFLHFGVDIFKAALQSGEFFFRKVHAGKIHLKSTFTVDESVLMATIDPNSGLHSSFSPVVRL